MVLLIIAFRLRHLWFVAEGLSVDQFLSFSVLVRYFGPFGFLLLLVDPDLLLGLGIHVCLGACIRSGLSLFG